MLEDHRKLHKAFNDYLEALNPALNPANQDKLIKSGKVMLELLMKHIEKEKDVVPELFKKSGQNL